MVKHILVKSRLALAALPLLLFSACQDGHLCFLGYTTKPNYDTNIRTVRVNVFQNRTPMFGLETDVEQSLIKAIESRTPYKVVGIGNEADTELCGIIKKVTKNVLNRTQQNETREEEAILEVEVVWRNVRTGELLTDRRRSTNPPTIPTIIPAPGNMPTPTGAPGDAPPPPPPPPLGGPALIGPIPGAPTPGGTILPGAVIVKSRASVIPELGESNAAARQRNADELAKEIVEMMETAWTNRP